MHETLYPITRQHKLKQIEEEFWDDFEHKTSLPTKEQHKTSSRTLQRNSKRRRTKVTDPRKKKTLPLQDHLWSRKDPHTKWNHHHGDTTKILQKNTTSQYNSSEQYYINRKNERYRRIKWHYIIDQMRKKHIQSREKKRFKSNKKKKTCFITHPRTQMYEHISKTMNIPQRECHFKKFNVKQCKQTIKASKTFIYSEQSYYA